MSKKVEPDGALGNTLPLTPSPFTRQHGGSLLVVDGPDRGRSAPVRDAGVVVGSAPECTLVLTDDRVSRKHLMAVRDGESVLLRDLGSRNGSYVQGARFETLDVGYGVEVRVGRTVLKYVPDEEAVEPTLSTADEFGEIAARSVEMKRVFGLLEDVSKTDATVLIEGETGTGKELVAEEIHAHSPRAAGPFVVFDCGAARPELIASSLFGHLKGAFTGAVANRKGAFVEAHGGTLFLDEVGELPLDVQPVLLRALDKRAVQPIGANAYQTVDVRIVAATNRDLRTEVAAGRFREDLYFRLAVVRAVLPPLRERPGDVDVLVDLFVRRFGGERALSVLPEDLAELRRSPWPGNVRELRNVVERACALAKDGRAAFARARSETASPGYSVTGTPPAGATDATGAGVEPFKEARARVIDRFQADYVLDLMKRHNMNFSAAAREAGIDRRYLRELFTKYRTER